MRLCSSSREESRVKDGQEVVGAGHIGLGGDADGISGVKPDRGGVEDRDVLNW